MLLNARSIVIAVGCSTPTIVFWLTMAAHWDSGWSHLSDAIIFVSTVASVALAVVSIILSLIFRQQPGFLVAAFINLTPIIALGYFLFFAISSNK